MLLESRRNLEYECYDDQNRNQGRAVLLQDRWEDKEVGLSTASHLKPQMSTMSGTQVRNPKQGAVSITCVIGMRQTVQLLSEK